MVLYDVQDHRAWLSNGLHAVLHLLRASLRHDSQSELATEFVYKEIDLQESYDVSNPGAAIAFLRNRHNLELPIYPDLDAIHTEQVTSGGQTVTQEMRMSRMVRLQDRVVQIIHILEQLIEYQSLAAMSTTPGIPLSLTPRSQLEGYRFMDIAARRPPTPRVVSLRQFSGGGKSWVDFTRAIRAVTLFGDGFGDLLVPRSPTVGTCDRWGLLPKGKDYLAVSTYDLSRILREEGSATSQPLRLAPGVFWHKPSTLFEACSCKDKGKGLLGVSLQKSCDRVQVLLPVAHLNRFWSGSHPGPIGTSGAVIFGRNQFFPWIWPEKGDPWEETLRGDFESAATEDLIESVPGSSTSGVPIWSSTVSESTQATPVSAGSQRREVGEMSPEPTQQKAGPLEANNVNKWKPLISWLRNEARKDKQNQDEGAKSKE